MRSTMMIQKGYTDTRTGEQFVAWRNLSGWRLRVLAQIARLCTAARATVLTRAGYACLGLAALALCASLSACEGSGAAAARAAARNEAAGATVAPVGAGVAAVVETQGAKKAVHLCGAPTKDGGTCKRHVRREGLRCWMHGGPGAAELDAAEAKKQDEMER
jgi:hypothetical protein